MNDILTEELVQELIEEYCYDRETIEELFNELMKKKCVNDDSEDKLINCLKDVLLEKSMEVRQNKEIEDGEIYYASDDYAINKALITNYGQRAMQDLSDGFVYFATVDYDHLTEDYQIRDSYSL